jgi:hypothetical protein
MTDDIQKDKVIDLSELSTEDKERAWEEWVRAEVNAALDIYLPISKTGHVNLSYTSTVIERTEAGDVLSDNLKDAVMISLIFEFAEPIDMAKPRIEDEETESDAE